jgi:formylglycine-generating enzyme required for sulfatase activity
MHGSLGEWCTDWYEDGYYAKSPMDDPAGAATGSLRVIRGVGWFDPARRCRSAYRNVVVPGLRLNLLGLRVSRVPADK